MAMDYHKRSYGSFHGRVHLQAASPIDASLVITEITLEDYGKYKCEVIDGLEDGTAVVSLDLEGTTNPPHPRLWPLCWAAVRPNLASRAVAARGKARSECSLTFDCSPRAASERLEVARSQKCRTRNSW